jgi:large conductance mechanosensitive channel
MWKEFREFILRGNVLDLAVAVIIGTAFTAIVNSLVTDILMPFIGILTGGIDFSGLSFQVGQAVIAYGKFIQATINFLIVAFVIFLLVRTINRIQRRFADPRTPDPAPPPEDIQLLREIRDLLKQRQV